MPEKFALRFASIGNTGALPVKFAPVLNDEFRPCSLNGLKIIRVAGHERTPQTQSYCGYEAIGKLKRRSLLRGPSVPT